MTDEKPISEFRQRMLAAKEAKRQVKQEWAFPSSFASEQILCFDQTLNSTGWAVIQGAGVTISVTEMGMCKPQKDDYSSFRATYNRAIDIRSQISRVLSRYHSLTVVHEMPAVGGMRTESSLISSVLIWLEVDRVGRNPNEVIKVVSNQTAKSILLPPGSKDKKDIGLMVDRVVPVESRPKGPWNEHVKDAIAVGMTYLADPERFNNV